MRRRRILFVTGTRADFGKLKRLMEAAEASEDFECVVFVTGMHNLKLYGRTANEIEKTGLSNVHTYYNQVLNEPMEVVLANTIVGLSRYLHEEIPDLIVVHGDRVETLAGAITGTLRNILVAHIEGGELSGTVDEFIRHATTKLSHVHFVANAEAANRLVQMGELRESVFTIGSPNIDVMLSADLPNITETKHWYQIGFDEYALGLFHPVTTEVEQLPDQVKGYVDALLASERNYVLVYPNNDEGTNLIISEYSRLEGNPRFRVFPSIRFEFFLALLKNARFVIGNSSAGIREAPVYRIPTVNIGTRQRDRLVSDSIIDVDHTVNGILGGIDRVANLQVGSASTHFGSGDSTERFMKILRGEEVWQVSRQKKFRDLPELNKLKTE